MHSSYRRQHLPLSSPTTPWNSRGGHYLILSTCCGRLLHPLYELRVQFSQQPPGRCQPHHTCGEPEGGSETSYWPDITQLLNGTAGIRTLVCLAARPTSFIIHPETSYQRWTDTINWTEERHARLCKAAALSWSDTASPHPWACGNVWGHFGFHNWRGWVLASCG